MTQANVVVFKEKDGTLFILAVKQHVIDSSTLCRRMVNTIRPFCPPKTTVVLMSEGNHRATYWGPRELVKSLAKIPYDLLPWKKINLPI